MADELLPTSYLIQPAQLLDELGQDKAMLADATPRLAGAIHRATIKLEAQLKTSFKPLTVTDVFLIERNGPVGRQAGMWRLLLTNGCVRSDEDITVSYASERKGTYETIEAEDWLIDRGRGFVQVDAEEISAPCWIKVQYTSGFLPEDDIPDEIQQALLCYSPKLLLSAKDIPSDAVPAAKMELAMASLLDGEGQIMSSRFMRQLGNVIKPFQSTAVEYVAPSP